MPMWLRHFGLTGSSPTSATSTAGLGLAQQGAAAGAYAAYANQTLTTGSTSNTVWLTTNSTWTTSQTAATGSATTVWWYDNQSGWQQEGSVEHWQYVALAHRRVELTEEQRAAEAERVRARELARQQREEQERLIREQTRAAREAALARSRELLLSHLTPAQRRTFEENNWFIVEGGATRTRYRIHTRGYAGNIEILHEDAAIVRLCGHLRENLPLYDHHVAQKISLEFDEEAFVRLCNRSAA